MATKKLFSHEEPKKRPRRDVEVEDEVEPPKARKRKRYAEDPLDEPSPSRALVVSKEEVKALQNTFGERASSIMELLDFGDTDGATSLIQKQLLRSLVSVIPMLEQNLHTSKGQRGAHGYNQTISQMREMLNDIQSQRDRGLLGQTIVERFLRPAFMDIGVQLQLSFTELETQATARLSPSDAKRYKTTVDLLKRNLSAYITQQYTEVSKSIAQALT